MAAREVYNTIKYQIATHQLMRFSSSKQSRLWHGAEMKFLGTKITREAEYRLQEG